MSEKSNKGLALAIVVAAVLVAAAIVYLGGQLAARPDEARVVQLIEERLGQRGQPAAEEAFNARVERGILAFIEKQQRAEEERPNQLARNVPVPSEADYVYGSPDAEVTLIEYSDFECPFCKRFHGTARQVVDASNGRVNWIYRHFPLASHNPGAQKQAEAAECAGELGGNDAFWAYTDALYERTRSGGRGFPLDRLVPLAVEQGLDGGEFGECLRSERHAGKVQRQMAEGVKAGINGTPGNILYHHGTGEVVAVHGARGFDDLVEGVGRLLRAAE